MNGQRVKHYYGEDTNQIVEAIELANDERANHAPCRDVKSGTAWEATRGEVTIVSFSFP